MDSPLRLMETVGINGLTLCHKHSDGWVRSTLPDVCKAPTIPVLFVNVAFAKDLAKGTKTVFSHGGAMNGIKGSEFSKSIGDEPGVGGGVKSGVNLHRATFLSWSPNVFMEGKPVTRLTDRMLLNKGNTISAGGYFTGTVTGASKATLDLLCSLACNCKGGKQTCVDLALKAMPKTANTGIYSEVTFDPAGNMLRNPDGSPRTQYGVPGSRLDVVTVAGGQPVEFIEMKFEDDRFRGNQKGRYESIARQNGKKLQVIDVEKDCECSDDKKGMTTGQKVGVGAALLGGAALLACAFLEPCGAIVGGGAVVGGLAGAM
jgi:hypothetical protein